MSKQMAADLKAGDRVQAQFVLSQKSLAPFKNKPGSYASVVLADRSGTIIGRVWDNADEFDAQVSTGDVVMVQGRVEDYKGTLQVIVEQAQTCAEGEFDRDDFLRAGKRDPAVILADLRRFLDMVQHRHLRPLLDHFFTDPDFLDAFTRAPGAKALHHSHVGGLAEHTVGVVKILLAVRECHPELDEDMLLAGALLHDIGKLKELAVDTGIDYTDTGRLVGHIVHTDRMVTAAIATIPDFPDELSDRLCHILLSHHGQKEYGAPIVPMTAEACALHYADNLDAHVQYFQQVIEQGTGSGNRWSEYQKLFDRFIYLGTAADTEGE